MADPNFLWCAVVVSNALSFVGLHETRGLPPNHQALMFLQEEAGDLADQLRFCGEEARAAGIDRLGRAYIHRARELEASPAAVSARPVEQPAPAALKALPTGFK